MHTELDFSLMVDRHPEEIFMIFGSGPSLDNVNFDALPDLPAICINHTIQVVPKELERYFIAVDWTVWRDYQGAPLDCIAVREEGIPGLLSRHAGIDSVPDGAVILPYRFSGFDRLITDRDQAAEEGSLYNCEGTATTAAALAWYLGARHVALFGFDASGAYADRVKDEYGRETYDRMAQTNELILQSTLRALRCLGVTWERFNQWV